APVKNKSTLRVTVSTPLAKALPIVLARVKDVFDLSCHPADVALALGKLAARFAGAFGEKIDTPFESLNRLFPLAPEIAERKISSLAKCTVTAARARSVLALARAVSGGRLSLAPGTHTETAV